MRPQVVPASGAVLAPAPTMRAFDTPSERTTASPRSAENSPAQSRLRFMNRLWMAWPLPSNTALNDSSAMRRTRSSKPVEMLGPMGSQPLPPLW